MGKKEKRKHSRVPVITSLSYICEDSEGNRLEQSMGVARNVSQVGIQIETTQIIQSECISLMFVNLENQLIEVKGEIVYCRKLESGKYLTGIKLQGSEKEVLKFVSGIVRFFHYHNGTSRSIISPAIP